MILELSFLDRVLMLTLGGDVSSFQHWICGITVCREIFFDIKIEKFKSSAILNLLGKIYLLF